MGNYRPWSPMDLEKLQQLIELDTPLETIQDELDRSKLSISNQIDKLSKGKVKTVVKQKKKVDLSPKTRRTQVEKAAINFLDMRVQNKDYSNVWSSILDFQEVLEEKSIEQPKAEIHINTNDWMGIAFLGDLHIGNMACNYKEMLKHRDLIANTDNLYMALNGDYCDNYIPSSHSAGMFEALFPPAVQKNLAKDYIESIKEKVLSLVSGCFMKGSKVTMADGTEKNIEDIEIGDHVLSGDGKSHRVSNRYANLHDGETLKIYSEGNNEPLHVTWDHPCLVLRREKVTKSGEKGLKKTAFTKDNLKEVRARDLRINDFICAPIPRTPIGGERENFGGYKYKISKNFMRLAGYWLAEGSYKKYKNEPNSLEFSFGDRDGKHIKEVEEICKEQNINYSKKDITGKNVVSVILKDKELTSMFFDLFGEYSHSKYMHPYILKQPATKLCHLMYAFGAGDGCLRQNKNGRWDMTLTTISRPLANGLSHILTKCSIPHSIRQQNRKNRDYDDYQVNFGEESIEYIKQILLKNDNNTLSRFPGLGRKIRTFDNMMWYRISKIEKEDFQGTTYNLTVPDTSEVVVNKRLCRQCHDIFGLKASDWDLTEYLARHGNAVYLGPGGILYLTVGKQKYKIMMRHKYKYNSSDNPTATVKKMFEKMGGFDVGIVSHHHLAAIEEGVKPGLDGALKRLFIRAGTYKIHDRFGRQSGFPEGILSVPVVLFNPEKRDIRGFQNIEEGIEFLDYLNSKK